jgi:2-phospho-L-lactate/phosphoenolpyruvate guanylyltransferase
MILVPIKNLTNAKQRLAALLDQATRTELAQAMLFDMLEVVSQCKARSEVGLVTTDVFAIKLARHFGFQVIPDQANSGETDAIAMATQFCESQGIKSTLVIPGDIPLIQASELDQILDAAPDEGSVIVPAADGRGTNAILRSPSGLFPLRFGNDSFKPHVAAARATGKPCVVVSLPGIGLDVDNPFDLKQLADAPGETRSQQLVRQWDLADLPLAANE